VSAQAIEKRIPSSVRHRGRRSAMRYPKRRLSAATGLPPHCAGGRRHVHRRARAVHRRGRASSTTRNELLVELAGDISFALEHIKKVRSLTTCYYDQLTGLANARFSSSA